MCVKILVTGGAGYIGSHTVVALLEAGYEPVIVDNFCNADHGMLNRLKTLTGNSIQHYVADCTDKEGLRSIFRREGNIEGVIHFAALKSVSESQLMPTEYYRNNLGSLWSVTDVMKEFGVNHLVFSSSATVYGEPDKLPVTETTPWQKATSPYGFSKQQGEQFLQDLYLSGAPIKSALLRYFNPIGAHPSGLIGESPNGPPANLIPYITQTAVGMRESLTIFGFDYDTPDGTCIRDYLHVMDLALAHVACLNHLINGPSSPSIDAFNLGTGKGVSVWEAVNTFEEVSGKPLQYSIGPRRDGDIAAIWADASKAKQQLGWTAQRSFSTALADAYRWQLQAAS